MQVSRRGQIESYSLADKAGRIRLDDGEIVRFESSALDGVMPGIGVAVVVQAVEPHPFGGQRATRITLAKQNEYEYLRRVAQLLHDAAKARQEGSRRADEQLGRMQDVREPATLNEEEAGCLAAWKEEARDEEEDEDEEEERLLEAEEMRKADIRRREAQLLFRNLPGPTAWSKLLRKARLSRWNTQDLLRLARPAARLVALPVADQVAGASSKLGGEPDLLPGFEWPLCEGKPLAFLGQIRLAEVPQAVLSSLGLPAEGLLSFFFEADKQPWGFDPHDKEAACVSFLADVERAARVPLPSAVPGRCRFRELPVRVIEELSMPSPDTPAVVKMEFGDELLDAYAEALDAYADADESAAHYVGGYAQSIQGAMERECSLVSHGINTSKDIDESRPDLPTILQEAISWRLLLQLDSDERLGSMWGDGGRLYFWMKEDDLRSLRFERAWAILQCF